MYYSILSILKKMVKEITFQNAALKKTVNKGSKTSMCNLHKANTLSSKTNRSLKYEKRVSRQPHNKM
jgi:hypothetical protein